MDKCKHCGGFSIFDGSLIHLETGDVTGTLGCMKQEKSPS
jgi:hypothetical protein